MNTKLLRKIQKEIEKEPLHFDINQWIGVTDSVAPCGTVGCIAGFAVTLDLRKTRRRASWAELGAAIRVGENHVDWRSVFLNQLAEKAKNLLELDDSSGKRLFYPEYWPEPFVSKYGKLHSAFVLEKENNAEKSGPFRASTKLRNIRHKLSRLAIDRIAHFIKTKGEE